MNCEISVNHVLDTLSSDASREDNIRKMKEKAHTKHTHTQLKPLKIRERVNTVKQQQPTHKLKHTGKSQVYTGVINRYHCRVLTHGDN